MRTQLQAMALKTLVASQRHRPRYGHITSDRSRDIVRQEKPTSPHSGYFHALDSSLFQSTHQFLGYMHPAADSLCEFAVCPTTSPELVLALRRVLVVAWGSELVLAHKKV